VRDGTLLIGGASLCGTRIFADETLLVDKTAGAVRIGMVTDLHYADKPTVGSRHYRETLMKLGEAANHFQQESPDFLVELGDLIDRADSVDTEMSYLQTVNQTFSAICKDRHYVLGNHCVDTLRKEEFLSAVAQPESYYSFDRGDFHFIVLDACFRGDGEPYGRKNFSWKDTNIPKSEVDWLRSDLQATKRKTVVFAHQRLDDTQSHSVINHAEVRSVLESSGNVLAVFQGHSHKNEVSEINGIHYCTMVAMVEGSGEESNAYAMMTLMPNGSIVVKGFRKQATYDWAMH
tara:strand:+ start:123270 stop:124139 length:870 start_codon:yes stop_codon:yes gene_type:complete